MLLCPDNLPLSSHRCCPCLQLAENLRLLRECRFANLSTLESLEALGQLSAPPPPDSDSAESEASSSEQALDPGAEQSAEAENRASQRDVLHALRLTKEQIAAVLEVCNALRPVLSDNIVDLTLLSLYAAAGVADQAHQRAPHQRHLLVLHRDQIGRVQCATCALCSQR